MTLELHRLFICLQVGGMEEYKIVEAIKDGTFHKPIVAWCIGTCARMFTSEVSIGQQVQLSKLFIFLSGMVHFTECEQNGPFSAGSVWPRW